MPLRILVSGFECDFEWIFLHNIWTHETLLPSIDVLIACLVVRIVSSTLGFLSWSQVDLAIEMNRQLLSRGVISLAVYFLLTVLVHHIDNLVRRLLIEVDRYGLPLRSLSCTFLIILGFATFLDWQKLLQTWRLLQFVRIVFLIEHFGVPDIEYPRIASYLMACHLLRILRETSMLSILIVHLNVGCSLYFHFDFRRGRIMIRIITLILSVERIQITVAGTLLIQCPEKIWIVTHLPLFELLLLTFYTVLRQLVPAVVGVPLRFVIQLDFEVTLLRQFLHINLHLLHLLAFVRPVALTSLHQFVKRDSPRSIIIQSRLAHLFILEPLGHYLKSLRFILLHFDWRQLSFYFSAYV